MSLGQWILLIAILASCILLILVILIQRGRGGGLAGAFGGGGSSAFGAKTGDVFTGITVAFACVFFLLNVFGNYILRVDDAGRATATAQPGTTPGPPAPTAPTPAPTAPPATGSPERGTSPQLPSPTPRLPADDSPTTPRGETSAAGDSGIESAEGDTEPTPDGDAEEIP